MEKPLSENDYLNYQDFQTEQDLLFKGEKIGQEVISCAQLDFPMDDIKELIEKLCKEFPIEILCEKEVDKFQNEVRINTFRSRTFAFPHNHPIDLLYISRPEGERFYVLYTGKNWIFPSGSIIFNINGNTNIVLRTNNDDDFLNGKTYEELVFFEDGLNLKKRWEYRSYLPISKDDFFKCCNAEHLSVRVCHDNTAKDYENDCDGIIPCFQMLYNQTCDNQMFAKTEEEWKEIFLKSTIKSFKKLYKLPEHKKDSANEVTTNKGCSFMFFLLIIVVAGGALTFFSL